VTNKVFYQAAAAEVASGAIDGALWIKVNAELPEADDRARQAKYIALRAEEMAGDSTKQRVLRWFPHSFWGWTVYLVVTLVFAYLVSAALDAITDKRLIFAPSLVFIAIILAGLCAPFILKRRWLA
jgi:hypothetical protein